MLWVDDNKCLIAFNDNIDKNFCYLNRKKNINSNYYNNDLTQERIATILNSNLINLTLINWEIKNNRITIETDNKRTRRIL